MKANSVKFRKKSHIGQVAFADRRKQSLRLACRKAYGGLARSLADNCR